MASGDSEIGLKNRALAKLGEMPIASLTEGSKRAILCNLYYDNVRQAELRRYPWNCAQRRATLAASATPPAFEYGNAFPLPADFLRFWNADDDTNESWSVESGQVLTDLSAPLNIVYIGDLTDVTRMDPLLAKVLVLELAIEICGPLTQSAAKKTELEQELQAIRPEAQLVDSQENSPREWDEDVWLRSRS